MDVCAYRVHDYETRAANGWTSIMGIIAVGGDSYYLNVG